MTFWGDVFMFLGDRFVDVFFGKVAIFFFSTLYVGTPRAVASKPTSGGTVYASSASGCLFFAVFQNCCFFGYFAKLYVGTPHAGGSPDAPGRTPAVHLELGPAQEAYGYATCCQNCCSACRFLKYVRFLVAQI